MFGQRKITWLAENAHISARLYPNGDILLTQAAGDLEANIYTTLEQLRSLVKTCDQAEQNGEGGDVR